MTEIMKKIREVYDWISQRRKALIVTGFVVFGILVLLTVAYAWRQWNHKAEPSLVSHPSTESIQDQLKALQGTGQGASTTELQNQLSALKKKNTSSTSIADIKKVLQSLK